MRCGLVGVFACVMMMTSSACRDCTQEDVDSNPVVGAFVHMEVVDAFNAQCGFDQNIEVSPFMHYRRQCFHDAALRDLREICSYSISVVYQDDLMCEALFIPREGPPRVRTVPRVLRLRGVIRLLVVGVSRTYTSLGTDWPAEIVAAQTAYNTALLADAMSVGRSEAIVQFDSTNVVVNAADLEDTGTAIYLDEVRLRARIDDLLSRPPRPAGFQTGDFDAVVVLAYDPHNPSPRAGAGGWASFRTIVVWGSRNMSSFVDVDAAGWSSMLGTAYGHEMSHLAGWPGTYPYPITGGTLADQSGVHYWPDSSDTTDVHWTHPKLLGWRDTNGNGIVDAVDPNPYAR